MPDVSIAELANGCPDCLEHYVDRPHLVEACASVGIEHGKSTAEMLAGYFRDYHERGHHA